MEGKNKFLAKFKNLPIDNINATMSKELAIFDKYCNKKIIIKTLIGSIWEGVLKHYDMFYLHVERNGEIEKFLLSEVDGIKEV